MNKFFTLAVDLNALGLAGLVRRITIELKRATVADSFVIVPDFKRSIEVSTATVNVLLLPNTAGSVYEITLHGGTGVLFGAYFIMPQANANLIDLNLLTAYPETGSTGCCKDGESAYTQWITYNTTENTYLELTDIYQLFQSSNYTTINEFITAINLTNVYNSWVTNNYEVENKYITENNLTEIYNTYIEDNSSTVFNDFLVSQNLTSNFNTWLTTHKTELTTLFLKTTLASAAYNSYIINHPNVTPREFLAAIGAEDGFNAWLEDRVSKLTEEAFNRMQTGKSGKTPVTSKFEKFWISMCGAYVPVPEGYEAPESQLDLVVNMITLPTDIFFEQHQTQHISVLSEQAFPIVMACDQGFYIKDAGHYSEEGTPYTDPIELVSDDSGDFNPFSMLSAGQRLYAKAGSTLGFTWSEKPTAEILTTVTLVAKKRVEADLDTATIKLSGWFKVHDSINGWIGDSKGLQYIVNLRQLELYSDSYRFIEDIIPSFFYDAFYISASGYNGNFQHGTVTVKNMSPFARQLTLVPNNSAPHYVSSIDELSNDLPPNVEMRNGAIILNLAANQDT